MKILEKTGQGLTSPSIVWRKSSLRLPPSLPPSLASAAESLHSSASFSGLCVLSKSIKHTHIHTYKW